MKIQKITEPITVQPTMCGYILIASSSESAKELEKIVVNLQKIYGKREYRQNHLDQVEDADQAS